MKTDKKKESIKNEIFRLISLEQRYNTVSNFISNSRKNKLTNLIKKKGYDYSYGFQNKIHLEIGNKEIYYILDNNKMSLKISSCEKHHPFVTEFYSKKQEERFKQEINKIKQDFRDKGILYSAFKKFLHQKSNDFENTYFQDRQRFSHRIDKQVDKYNKILEQELVIIEAGKTYYGDVDKYNKPKLYNLFAKYGYWQYRKRLDYLKIIKENPKTYQVEYKIHENGKVITKRMYKDDVIEMFNFDRKRSYEFEEEYKKLNDAM